MVVLFVGIKEINRWIDNIAGADFAVCNVR